MVILYIQSINRMNIIDSHVQLLHFAYQELILQSKQSLIANRLINYSIRFDCPSGNIIIILLFRIVRDLNLKIILYIKMRMKQKKKMVSTAYNILHQVL
ncbi:hypothetical protein DERF_008048 [Dermatophagoides farinae]|uniref:Uncharacterized protein n=1 Tax=Dermatophagoides farinae TaxID=6954 RepID=A0A922I4T3_DERFA|nr:hypothetical protein DERF_008048 [Dermatophagoides farinae]